ncbi:semaphorin-3A [Lates japonicus]|uniref:Semaphorin-3A n=1 Tax=Lates japonicus TaxID=270547 RepID=A0AAD3RI62_LATJO|nr:semaphorin-3A [Lates japonicus]
MGFLWGSIMLLFGVALLRMEGSGAQQTKTKNNVPRLKLSYKGHREYWENLCVSKTNVSVWVEPSSHSHMFLTLLKTYMNTAGKYLSRKHEPEQQPAPPQYEVLSEYS